MQMEHFDQSHAARNPMYGIYELSSGFTLQIGRRDSAFFVCRFFSYTQYVDPLASAQKVRDRIIRSKEFRQLAPGTQGLPSTTGFLGVTCEVSKPTARKRRCVFFVSDERRLHADGKPAKLCFSGIQRGPWLAYRQAVQLRHQHIGKRVTNKLIAQQYDQVFIPNYRERLEALELDWRRPE